MAYQITLKYERFVVRTFRLNTLKWIPWYFPPNWTYHRSYISRYNHDFICLPNFIAFSIFCPVSLHMINIFLYEIQHNLDCFSKNRFCSHCVVVENNENNQSDDLLLAEQSYWVNPYGTKVFRDKAPIRNAVVLFSDNHLI